jgi:glucosamine--fructose-6-phosphate aminotransferase (isomerizing)
MAFNPEVPLPGSPEPWAPSTMPALRDGPPYAMTEMIAAEPALAERIVRRLTGDAVTERLAEAIRRAAAHRQPILTTGCGTSEHGAMAIAALLADALRRAGLPADGVRSVQAFELAAHLPADGLLLAVSHEGGTWATNLAVERARDAGMRTALITVGPGSPGAQLAEHLVMTAEQDQSWCHTVGYLSPLVVAAVLAAAVAGDPLDPVLVRGLLGACDDAASAEGVAQRLQGIRRILVIGSGIDYVSARELALKIEEGARLPATALQLETLLHGHLAATDASTGLVLLLADGEGRGSELVERASAVLRAGAEIGMVAATIVAADRGDDLPEELTLAGRLAVPLTHHLARLAAAAIGSAIPLQLLAERLARARGVNPDSIGRDDPRQAAAAQT